MGGYVFSGGSDRIAREDIKPTLDAYLKEINRLFPKAYRWYENPVTLGSVGKKDYSGDIDLAIDAAGLSVLDDWNLNETHVEELYKKFKSRARTATDEQLHRRAALTAISEYINDNSDSIFTNSKSAGSGSLFSQFGQIDHISGEKNGKTVQIDQMFGNIDWLKFAYYSDTYTGNVKGLHRTQLMLHMFAYKGYVFNHGTNVKNKETQEIVATTPEQAISLLNSLYGLELNEQILSNYHELQKYLHDNLDTEILNGIYDIYLKTLDSTRCDIPDDMQEYWKNNQARLTLSGQFLPEESNLNKYKTICQVQ